MSARGVVTGWSLCRPDRGASLDADVAGIPESRRRHADRTALLALAAAHAAFVDARLAPPPADTALAFAVGFGTYAMNGAHQRRLLAEGPGLVSPAEFTLTLPNITAAFVSIAFGLQGETTTFADDTLAGATALGHALDLVRRGVEPVLVGAAEDLSGDVSAGCAAAGLPGVAAAGEFGVAFVLESVAGATRRAAPARAFVDGYGAAADPVRALAAAWADAAGAGPPPPGRPLETGPAALAIGRALASPGDPTSLVFAGPPCAPGARAIILRAP